MPGSPDINAELGVGQPRARGRKLLLTVLILVAVGSGAAFWRLGTTGDPTEVFVTAPVSRGDLTAVVTAKGTVEPTNLVEISSELSGTIRSVDVDFNDTVAVGQDLAHLDSGKLEAAVAHGRATLEAREARIDEADATVAETLAQLDRIRALADRDISDMGAVRVGQTAFVPLSFGPGEA